MEALIVNFAKDIAINKPILAYTFFFINSVLQILFPPYPGDTIIVFQGYLSLEGILNPYFLLFNILVGTVLSSIFLYYLGYAHGDKVLNNNFINKYFKISKIYCLNKWFEKYGSLIVILSKFTPGLGSIAFIAAGLFKLPPVRTIISIGIACILQNATLYMGGRIAGENIDFIKHLINEYSLIILLSILIAFIAYFIIKYFRKKSIKK